MSENISPDTDHLGTVKVGALPLSFSARFDDADGNQIAISTGGYAAKAYFRERSSSAPAKQIDASKVSIAGDLVVVEWEAAMTAEAGSYFVEVWVGLSDDTVKLGSRTFSYYVEDSIIGGAISFA